MSSLLTDILVQVLGDSLFNQKPSPPPPEGIVNGSLGAIATFLGFLSVLFALPAVLNFVTGGIATGLIISVVVVALASGGIATGRRAPRYTSRNLALARFGCGASILAILGSGFGLAFGLIRALM